MNSDEEVAKFNRLGSAWHDPKSHMRVLLAMNKARVPFIKKGILGSQNRSTLNKSESSQLAGYTILDIGCGGGFLSEGLGRLGASVIGIDPGEDNVKVADAHLTSDLRKYVSYQNITIQDFVKDNPNKLFDAVVISEVIEHVDDPQDFIGSAVSALKEGGSIILTTPNRTFMAWFGMIFMGEYVTRQVPIGTHFYSKFISPKSLKEMLEYNGCRVQCTKGMLYNPITNTWYLSRSKIHAYAIHAVKENSKSLSS